MLSRLTRRPTHMVAPAVCAGMPPAVNSYDESLAQAPYNLAARCHTCDAAASAGARYGMTRDEAQQWIDDHECEPDVWLIEPEEEK